MIFKNYFTKCKKINMTIISITLFFVHPLIAKSSINYSQVQYNQIQKDLFFSQSNNLLPENINIVVKPLILKIHQRDKDYLSNIRADQSCQIDISLSEEGYVGYLGSMQNKKSYLDTVSPANQFQTEIVRKFMVLHEASHCLFSKNTSPILMGNDKNLEKEINYFFKLAAAAKEENNITNHSLYQILNENFADTFAAVNLIYQYGNNNDVIEMLHKISTQRYEQALVIEKEFNMIAHDTHFALEAILSEDTIEKIIAVKDKNLLPILALQIANDSVSNVLINNKVEQALNKKSVLSGIRNNLIDINLQKNSELNGSLSTLTNYQFASNNDNSFIFKVATSIINNNKVYKQYKLLDKIEQQDDFIENYINKNLKVNIQEKVIIYMNAYKEYIGKQYSQNYLAMIEENTSDSEMQERYDMIKEQLETKLLAIKQSNLINNTINNINER